MTGFRSVWRGRRGDSASVHAGEDDGIACRPDLCDGRMEKGRRPSSLDPVGRLPPQHVDDGSPVVAKAGRARPHLAGNADGFGSRRRRMCDTTQVLPASARQSTTVNRLQAVARHAPGSSSTSQGCVCDRFRAGGATGVAAARLVAIPC